MNHPGPNRGNANPDEPFIPDLSEGAETGVYLALLELIDEGLIITGDERIIDANSAACRLLERDYRQVAGRPLDELFVDQKAFIEARARLFIQGEMRGSLEIALPDGATRNFRFVAAARLRPGIHALILSPETPGDEAHATTPDLVAHGLGAGIADNMWPRLAAALIQPVIVVDEHQRISAANAAALDALGLDRGSLIGQDAGACLNIRWPAAGAPPLAQLNPHKGTRAEQITARMLAGPRDGWHLLILPPATPAPHAESAPVQGPASETTATRSAGPSRFETTALELHFQPLVHARSGAIHSGEALLRWQHPRLGLRSFSQFVDLARDEGRLPELGGWTLRSACRAASQWPRAHGRALGVTVNVSIEQLLHGALVQQVTTALAESGIEPHRLELDLDEQVLTLSETSIDATLRALSDLGVRLAVDDFGHGLSNIPRLKHYPIRALKLAPELVCQIGKDDASDALVEALALMCGPLDLRVLARGVENEAQQAFLLALGCELQQGALFGAPMTAPHFSAFLTGQLFC